MNKNILIVLGGAIAVAVLVAILVQVSLGDREAPVTPLDAAKVQILVADKDLGIGRELQDGDLRWQEWPENSVFPGAIVRSDETQSADSALEGRLSRGVSKGEPVMQTALLGQTKGNFVAASLEPGMRAIAIEVSASSMVGGFIEPGDYVDVIMTYKDSIRSDIDDPRIKSLIELSLDKMATETILQNIKVLAVDQMAIKTEEDKIKVGKTVTLAVNAEEAEKLSLASELGMLTLALRGVGDNTIVEKVWPTISDARLTNVTDEIYRDYDRLRKETGIRSNNVRIYNGSQIYSVPSH